MPSKIQNVSGLTLPMPAPYSGILKGGQAAVVADGVSAALAALGGAPYSSNVFAVVAQPSGTALTPHGAGLVDESIAGPTASVNLNVRSSRFDLVGGGGSCTASVPPGQYAGQRHYFYQASQTGAAKASIVPQSGMWENRQALALQSLGAWACLEWQLQGISGPANAGLNGAWKIAELGGPTGSSVALI